MGGIAKLERVTRAARRLGPVGFARLCLHNAALLASGRSNAHAFVYDLSWDRLHGVDTAGSLDVAEMSAPQAQKRGAVRYEPTPPECFAFLVEAAGVSEPRDYTLVDLGSGKGRVPLLAGLSGFGTAVGIEMAAELHAAALDNLAALRARQPLPDIRLTRGDARAFAWPDAPTLCFLNNPFDADVLDEVLDAIEASLLQSPRNFRIVYYHCNHHGRIDSRPGWQAIARGHWRDPSHHYAIYRRRQ